MNLLPQSFTANPTLDTAAYASGDYMASGSIANFFADKGRCANIISLSVMDKAKQKAAFDIFFFDTAPVVTSAVNAAIDIADSEMTKFLGHISVATGDYATDLAGSSIATKSNIQLLLDAADADKNLYYVLVIRAAGTYAANDLYIKLDAIRY